MRLPVILAFVFSLFLIGCEGTNPVPGTVAGITTPSFEVTSLLAARPPIKLPQPPRGSPSADYSFGISYANAVKSQIANLRGQFETSMATAVTQEIITEKQRVQILRAVASRQNLLNRSMNRYIRRMNRALSARLNDAQTQRAFRRVLRKAVSIRFPSPFDPPVKLIPGAQKKGVLASIRKRLGQIELFSGFSIVFIEAIDASSGSASQQDLASRLEAKLRTALTKDINAIKKLINLVNVRRFKTLNRSAINPSDFVGDYTGTCTNFANGLQENISATIAYDTDTNTLQIDFPRPTNVFGTGSNESFSSLFDGSGLLYEDISAKFGDVKVRISPRGFISGRIITDTVSTIDSAKYWGAAKSSDLSIIIDLRMDFASLSQGGSAHAQMDLMKTP